MQVVKEKGHIAAHGRYSLYFTMECPFPLNIALSHRDLDPHLTYGSLGPPEFKTQMASQVVFAGLTIVTDHATPSLTIGCIYLVLGQCIPLPTHVLPVPPSGEFSMNE